MERLKYNHEQTLKPSDIEQRLDFYLYRRLAAYLVRAVLNTSITPNQITLLSLVLGVSSAISYVLGFNPILSALLLLLSVVSDCADGQLARARGVGSPRGAQLDGLADYLVGIILYIAVGYHLKSLFPETYVNIVMLLAIISTFLQCYLFDLVKNLYLSQTEQNFKGGVITLSEGKTYLKESKTNRNWLYIILDGILVIYLYGTKLIKQFTSQEKLKDDEDSPTHIGKETVKVYKDTHRITMQLWTYLGYSTHLTAFIIAFLLEPFFSGSLIYAFWFTIIPLNLFLIIVGLAKWVAVKQFDRISRSIPNESEEKDPKSLNLQKHL